MFIIPSRIQNLKSAAHIGAQNNLKDLLKAHLTVVSDSDEVTDGEIEIPLYILLL